MPRAAVLGSPIQHSLSPTLHRAAYRCLGLEWDYTAIECTADRFPAFFAELDDQWRGLSLTMPLKEVVLEVVEDVDALARDVHSANTVYRLDAGAPWRATNTDIEGMARALQQAGIASIDSGTILGAGATARSAVAALARLGVRSVGIHARRLDAAQSVAALAEGLGLEASSADLSPVVVDRDVVVSTLPADAAAPWAEVIGRSPHVALLDASYHPWPTPLAAALQGHEGAVVASGRDMLIWQAVAQVRLMTGMDFDDLEMAQVMRSALVE